MGTNTNRACTLDIRQIEKSAILTLGMSDKDVRKYEKVASSFGSVTPAIVGETDKGYRVLDGQAKLMAYAHAGIDEVPVIVAQADGEAGQMKLALLLSTIREEGGAISEGIFIDKLITQHGVTRQELTQLIGKSKAWLSKRQSLACNLSDAVKDMVRTGAICARTAEEIVKLPKDKQAVFSANVVQDALSKSDVEHLVKIYRDKQTSDSCRNAILTAPLTVLPVTEKKQPIRRQDKRSESERIAGATRYAIRLACELKGLIAAADDASLILVLPHLRELYSANEDLGILFYELFGRVSPGKQQEGSNQYD
jgi:ParB/RepB/Spo0J family partition protein